MLEKKKMDPAGDFITWLGQIRNTQKSNDGMKVPCGDCRACCTSSYFIHIRPSENNTLSKIPKELLFPAPGLPRGNVLMGYDERGYCPMFVNNACSIYDYRPQTCRNFDCRIFTASGLSESDDKPLIQKQSYRWQFDNTSGRGYKHLQAVKNTAAFLNEYSKFFPDGFVPKNATQQAILAIKVYEVFLDRTQESIKCRNDNMIREITRAIVLASEAFDKGKNLK